MARTDLGEKQVCPSCGAKFYDLRKRPAMCPKCSTSFDPADEGVRIRRPRSRVAAHDPALEEEEELETEAGERDEEDEEAEEETVEVDMEAEAEPVLADDEDEDAAPPSADVIPEGFSEEDPELEDAADDDTVPLLEDEEEFPEDELGDLSGEDEDDDSGR